jgi:hypothetical protein
MHEQQADGKAAEYNDDETHELSLLRERRRRLTDATTDGKGRSQQTLRRLTVSHAWAVQRRSDSARRIWLETTIGGTVAFGIRTRKNSLIKRAREIASRVDSWG